MVSPDHSESSVRVPKSVRSPIDLLMAKMTAEVPKSLELLPYVLRARETFQSPKVANTLLAFTRSMGVAAQREGITPTLSGLVRVVGVATERFDVSPVDGVPILFTLCAKLGWVKRTGAISFAFVLEPEGMTPEEVAWYDSRANGMLGDETAKEILAILALPEKDAAMVEDILNDVFA